VIRAVTDSMYVPEQHKYISLSLGVVNGSLLLSHAQKPITTIV